VTGLAFGDGHDEVETEGQPYHGDCQVDRPFQLSILFGLGDTQWQSDDCGDNDQVPSVEGEPGHLGAPQGNTTGTLHTVKAGGKQCASTERKYNGVGM